MGQNGYCPDYCDGTVLLASVALGLDDDLGEQVQDLADLPELSPEPVGLGLELVSHLGGPLDHASGPPLGCLLLDSDDRRLERLDPVPKDPDPPRRLAPRSFGGGLAGCEDAGDTLRP